MVDSGVPQSSVLGPILCLIYVDDATRDLDCEVAMFADDMKIWSAIRGSADEDRLLMILNRLEEWSNRWLLRFNVAKCSILRLGTTARSASTRNYFLGGAALKEVEAQKDLGVLTTSSLKPSAHCLRLAESAMSLLERSNFGAWAERGCDRFRFWYKTMSDGEDLQEDEFSVEKILRATTIFAANEDIQEGQVIVFLLLHRKLNVREDGVEMFFECQHLIPFDDDEGVIHIPSPEFRSVVSENPRLQPL
nr:unnamed protein product [Spirometra erinaceieuropaei]